MGYGNNANYEELNLRAYLGTAEELKVLLFKHGHDKNAVLAIQNGLDGEGNDGRTTYKGPVAEFAAKNAIMRDFRAKTGDFSPQSAESKLAAEFNRMAAELEDLKNRNKDLQQELAKERARKGRQDWPSIH